jgi:hypothetical protein
MVIQVVNNFPFSFLKIEGSLLSLYDTNTGVYLELVESIPHFHVSKSNLHF